MLNFGLLNDHSIVNKAALIHDVITNHSLDLFAITETWVYEDSPNVHKHEAAPLSATRTVHRSLARTGRTAVG